MSRQSSRGISVPTLSTLAALAAGLCALWLVIQEFSGPAATAKPDPGEEALTRAQSIERLVELGQEGVPELVRSCSDPDPKVRRYALTGLGLIGREAAEALDLVRRATTDEDAAVRTNAVGAFARISNDPEAIGEIAARALADPQEMVRDAAVKLLDATDDVSLLAVVDALKEEPAATRLKTFFIISRLSHFRGRPRMPAELRPALERLAEDPDAQVRIEARMALATTPDQIRELLKADYTRPAEYASLARFSAFGHQGRSLDAGLYAIAKLGPAGAELLPEVLDLLDGQTKLDTASGGRYERTLTPTFRALLGALHGMHEAARPAAPRLLARIDELTTRDRLEVVDALGDIGTEPREIAEVLLPLLVDAEPTLCYEAGQRLAILCPDEARRQVELRVGQLQGVTSPDSVRALHAVYGMARHAQTAVPALIALVERHDANSFLAIGALGKIGPGATPSVPILMERLVELPLDQKGAHQICQIIAALGRIGPPSRPAVPMLLEIMATATPRVATQPQERSWTSLERAGACALGRIGDARSEVLSALYAAAGSLDLRARSHALHSLARLLPDSPQILSECLEFVAGRGTGSVGLSVILRIGEMTVDRRSAVAPLAALLTDPDPSVRAAAAVTLGRIGPLAPDALPALRDALKEEPSSVRRNWRWPLWGNELSELLNEDDLPPAPHSVAEAIERALEQIETRERPAAPTRIESAPE